MNKNHHPLALLLHGPTKYLLVLWVMLSCLGFLIALEANGILHIGPGGATGAIVGLIFVGVIWLTASIELMRRWVAR